MCVVTILWVRCLFLIDQSVKDCLIIMIGDEDHVIRMKIADTMTTLYESSKALMSCDHQEAIYQQITNTLQIIITLNVSKQYIVEYIDEYKLSRCNFL